MPNENTSTSTQAETSLLAAVLSDPSKLDELVDVLAATAAVFSVPMHRKVWMEIMQRYSNGDGIDPVTVADAVGCDSQRLLDMEPVMPLKAAARMVISKYRQRQVLAISGEIREKVAENVAPEKVVEMVQQRAYEIDENINTDQYSELTTVAAGALARLEHVAGSNDGLIGVPSGYSDLDAYTGGWQETDLTIIAGRPSMGKTAFALAIARNAARRGFPVGFFSLEMGEQQLGQRLLTMEAKIDAHRARTGKLNADEMEAVRRAMKTMPTDIYIDDSSGITPMRMRSVARRMIREKGVKLLIVDYLQLMTSGGLYPHREQEVAFVSRSLKGIAKDLDVPVIALAQLNRAVEARRGFVPQLSDLRESGQIEQDADNVIFLHRPEYYGIEVDEDGNSTAGIAEARITKQRNGPLGVVSLAFIAEYAGFHSLSRSVVPQSPTAASPASDMPSDELPF